MASYKCTGCGLGECNVGVSTDEMDPVQFMSRFKCTVWSDVCTDLELEDAEGHHRDVHTGIPLGTKDGLCVLDWKPCGQPAVSEACKICQKVKKLQDGSDEFFVGQEVWYVHRDAMEILRTERGECPQFLRTDPNVLHRGYVESVDENDVTITLEPYMNEPHSREEMRTKGCGIKQVICNSKDVFCTPEEAIAAFLDKTKKELEKQLTWFTREQKIQDLLADEDQAKRIAEESKEKPL